MTLTNTGNCVFRLCILKKEKLENNNKGFVW